jgi:hypothetical protein
MIVAVARAVMTLAVSCLGDSRRDWALAMRAEFEAAGEDGRQLAFALGCLMAAWRELPAHEEGRFTIASHVLAFALIIPMAGLLVSSMVVADFPYSYLAQVEAQGLLDASGGQAPLLSDANRSAVPSLAGLVVLVAAAHLRIAWLVLERDWVRVAALGTLLAAATVTLIIFTAVVFAYFAFPLTQAAALIIELTGISLLARWHGRSFGSSSEALN